VIAHLISRNRSLTQLDLGGNQLGAESGKAMVEALIANTTLTQLSLYGNKLGDAGGCALSVALLTNTTLAQLDVGDNELGDAAGCALAEVLKTNTTLRKLDLGGNEFGAKSGHSMSGALKTNTTLQRLDMSSCRLDAASVRCLREASSSTSLSLEFRWCCGHCGSQLFNGTWTKESGPLSESQIFDLHCGECHYGFSALIEPSYDPRYGVESGMFPVRVREYETDDRNSRRTSSYGKVICLADQIEVESA
jgi:hypothetical protein